MIGPILSGLAVGASRTALKAAVKVQLALSDPKPCLPPGMDVPTLRAIGWVKAIGLLVCAVSIIRIGMHLAKQQGDGVPDRDDAGDKVFNIALAAFFISASLSLLLGLGVNIVDSCA